MSEQYHVLSNGGGINSTALLLEAVERSLPIDEIVFADTASELPKTYENLDLMAEFAEANGIKASTVVFGDLYRHCDERHIIPSRRHRWCTAKFKIRPIAKHLEGKETVCYMGIATEEAHRSRPNKAKNIQNRFPLLEWGLSRNDCIRIIKEHKWPMPIKSGCFFCPFQNLKGWQHLYHNYPDYFSKAEKLESKNLKYPDFIFNRQPLSEMRKSRSIFGADSQQLTNFDEELAYAPACDSGYCMI